MDEIKLLAQKKDYDFSDLVRIVAILRGPNGCPWDREQSHRDLRNNLLEEAYEVCEGIDRDDAAILQEELGDVLLQIVFHAGIEAERGRFTLQEVIGDICRKMIRRHPHIFSDDKSVPSWEELKKKERGDQSLSDTLKAISPALPALTRAQKMLRRTNGATVSPASREEEAVQWGEKLFDLCRACESDGVDAEEALNRYLQYFSSKCTIC